MPIDDLPPHLPLPGERPVTIYRQHTQRRQRLYLAGLWQALPFLLVMALLLGGVVVWQATRTPVTVVVNGAPVTVRTHRPRVAGAVRAAGVSPREALFVQPAPDARLEAGMLITVTDLRPIIVHVDGRRLIVDTHHTDPAQIVAAAGVTLGEGDALRVERQTAPSAAAIAENPAMAEVPALPREIRVLRQSTVIVTEMAAGGSSRVSFQTVQPTLGEALSTAGYALYEADIVEPALDTALETGTMEVSITRAVPVRVEAEGQTFSVRTHSRTAEGVLAELGLALTGEDYLLPGLDASITPGAALRLVRVREEVLLDEVPIPFETVYTPLPEREIDTLVEVQPGTEGVLNRQVTRRYEDARLVSEVPGGEWVVSQPQPRVLGYGTRIVIRTVMTERGEIEYWRQMRLLATSYSPSTAGSKQPGDPGFGLSGTGAPMQRGIVATDPRVIPLFTRMWVPDYGFAQALDVGGAVKGMRVDLGYDDENLVLWNNWVDVYLTLPIPPADQIVWVLPSTEVTEP